jgi:protein-L-isoaspartate(D-aspartate) O-methyltransferase
MDYPDARAHMVRDQLAARGISDPRVLQVMGRTPREMFVPAEAREQAYDDTPLLIGEDQTISQPFIVALMTEALHLRGREIVLEVGAGSGYQTAILAQLAGRVWAVEQHSWLASRALAALSDLKIENVTLSVGDGSAGWPEHAPYDAILVAASAPAVPDPLLAQLQTGGRIVIPVGPPGGSQELECWQRLAEGWRVEHLLPVRFVPLRGQWGWRA